MIICSTMVYGQEHDGYYTNPILSSGADPWVIKHEGWYYYCSGVPGGMYHHMVFRHSAGYNKCSHFRPARRIRV